MKEINGLFVIDVQLPDVADPPTTPTTIAELLPQITWSVPASAVAIGLIVIITVSLSELHGPTGSLDVKTNWTVPAALSVAERM